MLPSEQTYGGKEEKQVEVHILWKMTERGTGRYSHFHRRKEFLGFMEIKFRMITE